MKAGLYIHVPFCVRKCPYCDFYSVPASDSNLYRKYTDAVLRNIKRYTENNPSLKFDTVYFGGGTPSLMPAYFFSEVLETAEKFITDSPEITMELNPGTADRTKLRDICSSGVNRVSVGIQSSSDEELQYLGRIHSFDDVLRAVDDVRSAGIKNISGDLMIGIRGQTHASLAESVKQLAALELQHISSYMLKIEQGTEYSRSGISALVPDEDETADMYLLAVEKLREYGYEQYEISNFSKPGFESRHNLKYWNCEEYAGIGPSAHSYFGGVRFEVPRSLQDFTDSRYQTEVTNEENPGDFFEKAMLALRLTKGLDLSLYPAERERVLRRAARFSGTGLLSINDSVISLSPEGFLVSNQLISELLCDF